MSKKLKILEAETCHILPMPPDWGLCILCQQNTKEKLTCPNNSKNASSPGYQNLASNLESFSSINALPSNIKLETLNDGTGLEETLKSNSAKWHQTCRLKYNNSKLKRAQSISEGSDRGEGLGTKYL